MLASIHPLGERGRRQRWGITTTAYVVGSTAGGATFGVALGSLGTLIPGTWRTMAVIAAAVCALAGALDARRHLRPVPTIRRQVNEHWLTTLRGWVYGVGFGYQLGLGVVTIVSTALVDATFALALVSRSPIAGACIGAAFGLSRALPIMAVRRVHDSDSLRLLHKRFQSLEGAARRMALVGSTTVAAALSLLAVLSIAGTA